MQQLRATRVHKPTVTIFSLNISRSTNVRTIPNLRAYVNKHTQGQIFFFGGGGASTKQTIIRFFFTYKFKTHYNKNYQFQYGLKSQHSNQNITS